MTTSNIYLPFIIEKFLHNLSSSNVPHAYVMVSRTSDQIKPIIHHGGTKKIRNIAQLGHRRIGYLDPILTPVPQDYR